MPFAFYAPSVEAGVLEFSVFGAPAVADSPLMLSVLEQAAGNGIGKVRHAYRLRSAHARIFPAAASCLPDGLSADALPDLPPFGGHAVEVRLLSPLRLQVKGRVMSVEDFSAAEFLRALLRRITLLHWSYGTAALPPVPLPAIDEVTSSAEQLRWQTGARYSARQAQRIPLDGLVGSFNLSGPGLRELWPWLYIGQWTQVGKSVTQGLGQFTLIDRSGSQACWGAVPGWFPA
ncbi:hypothetical protein A9404_04075 [Halothiobacillus diazotrophicus]|uniref:CRISPR-associated protein Cas6 C-terminal domain-containing protein n=1 Tax=Halothiobacillus diazotrophicus TaxID=1860122 RepID=A0A191ZFN1_9GAMM|nr:CRISPR system precrRNA processing endoribonuclease RAMP protein Cas6 [Halothiobacillus diazotrophicus]ANJ66665.1 hypothetical protein A9404_04075 [Halothiobacillus diazotrophicus]